MSWNILGVLYNGLSGFRIMIDIDFLKWKGSMHKYAILIMLVSLTKALK